MPRRQNRAAVQSDDQAAPTQIEAMIAKTLKLPVSIDERLRRHCFESRRTGQDIMLAAVVAYLDRIEKQHIKN